jgi:prevent-host-death family protein
MPTKILNVTEVRQQFSQLVRALDEPIYVTVYGKPQAVLLSYDTYEAMHEKIEGLQRAQVDKSKKAAARQLMKIGLTNVPEPDKLAEEIKRAVEA